MEQPQAPFYINILLSWTRFFSMYDKVSVYAEALKTFLSPLAYAAH